MLEYKNIGCFWFQRIGGFLGCLEERSSPGWRWLKYFTSLILLINHTSLSSYSHLVIDSNARLFYTQDRNHLLFIIESLVLHKFFVVVFQSLSCVQLFATPWTAAHQASLSSTISQSLLKFTSIKLVMLFNHLILCRPLLRLPSIFDSISVFRMRWFLASGGQSIGISASASVLPVNIRDWFALGLTGLISLQSRELSQTAKYLLKGWMDEWMKSLRHKEMTSPVYPLPFLSCLPLGGMGWEPGL